VQYVRFAWKVEPAIAVNMVERFKYSVVQQEVTRLIQANPREAIHVPGAIKYLLGLRLDPRVRRDVKARLFLPRVAL
jgi:phosphatidylinositol 4-kinase